MKYRKSNSKSNLLGAKWINGIESTYIFRKEMINSGELLNIIQQKRFIIHRRN